MGKALIRAVLVVLTGLCVAGGCACLLGGCELDPEARLALYATALSDADARIDALETTLIEGRALLADVNLPAMERTQILATIDDTRVVLAKVQAWRAKVQAAVERAQQGGSEWDVLSDSLTAGGSAVGGPVGGYLALGGLIVSIVGNALQRRQVLAKSATLGAIVRGVQASPTEAQAVVKPQIEAKMKAAKIYDLANGLVDQLKAA